MNKDQQKKAQQKYVELQTIGQQIQSCQKQLQLMEQQIMELEIAKNALDDISRTKPGTEILVPVTSGMFIKAELRDNRELMVNVGSGTAVKKSVEDSMKLLDEQSNEIKKFQMQLSIELQTISQKAVLIEKKLSELPK